MVTNTKSYVENGFSSAESEMLCTLASWTRSRRLQPDFAAMNEADKENKHTWLRSKVMAKAMLTITLISFRKNPVQLVTSQILQRRRRREALPPCPKYTSVQEA